MRGIKILLLVFFLLISAYTVYALSITIVLPEANANIGPLNTSAYPLYTVNVTVDTWANVTLMNITIDGLEVCSNDSINLTSYICVWNTSLTGEGVYTIAANATNSTGSLVDDLSTNITIDATNATMVLNYPANNGNVSGTVNFNWTATDNFDLSLLCNLTIDGAINATADSLNNTAANFSVPGLTEGTHTWNVTCTDNAFNSDTSETYSFVVDNTVPAVTLTDPASGSSSLSSVNFKWNASDNLATQTLCNLTVNNVIRTSNVATLNGTETSYFVSGLATGANYWNVTCIDPAGNSNTSETFLITINPTPSPGGSSGGGNSASRFYTQQEIPITNIGTEEIFMSPNTYSSYRINVNNNIYDLGITRILDEAVELTIGYTTFRAEKNAITTVDLDFDKSDDLSMEITDIFFNRVNMILKSLASVKEVVSLPEEKSLIEDQTELEQHVSPEATVETMPLVREDSKISKTAIIVAILAILGVIIYICVHYFKPPKKKKLGF